MRALIAGLSSGLLYWLSIPRADIESAAWICLVPCLLIRTGERSRLLLAAAAAGLLSSIGRVYWIAETLHRFGDVPYAPAVFTNALLVIYLTLYPVCFFALCSRLRVGSPLFPWMAASIWVLLEWTQSWMISGFPWELLGYSQYLNRPILQVCSVAGVYGLSFVIVTVNTAIAQLILLRRTPFRILGPPVLLVGIGLLYGYHRMDRATTSATTTAESITVGIVQGNVVQDLKWDPEFLTRTVDKYVQLTRQLDIEEPIDLIVFPETALPMRFSASQNRTHRDRITALAREFGTPFLVGSLDRSEQHTQAAEYQTDAVRPTSYNRAFLIDASGQIIDSADKVHLVPFGEYLPFPSIFKYLGGLIAQSGAFEPGKEHRPLQIEPELALGVFVCFESVFPKIARTLVQRGATVLVNMTNDAWFGTTAAPYQHFSMSVVRAVETGRPLIRAANTGISGLVSSTGEIVQTTGIFETEVLTVETRPKSEMTLYVRYGDVLVALCALFLLGIGGHRLCRNRTGT